MYSYEDWCKHYEYDPSNTESNKDYKKYCEKLDFFRAENDGQEFDAAWHLWLHKGHSAAEKLRIFDSIDEQGRTWYQVAILDYLTLETYVYPSSKEYLSLEQAFAAVGRALDVHKNNN